MARRTRAGTAPAEARDQYGDEDNKWPIFDRRSALAALRLRGHAKNKRKRSSIIRRAARFVPDKAQEARAKDKAEGKV